jgi:hypothetical protein
MADRADIADRLRRLADQLDGLELPDVIGALEAAKAEAWAQLTTLPVPASSEPVCDLAQHEAARLRPALGLKCIRYLTRTGRVPSVARGRQRLVRLADLDAYVDRCRQQGVALGRIRDVSSSHDRRRSARHPHAARPDAASVR